MKVGSSFLLTLHDKIFPDTFARLDTNRRAAKADNTEGHLYTMAIWMRKDMVYIVDQLYRTLAGPDSLYHNRGAPGEGEFDML